MIAGSLIFATGIEYATSTDLSGDTNGPWGGRHDTQHIAMGILGTGLAVFVLSAAAGLVGLARLAPEHFDRDRDDVAPAPATEVPERLGVQVCFTAARVGATEIRDVCFPDAEVCRQQRQVVLQRTDVYAAPSPCQVRDHPR